MSETMNLSVNGHSQVPPGFRFHPTEEELLHYYLRKKVSSHKIDLDVIPEVDLNKLEPWDIQEKCKIGSTPQNDWYFFSHKDKKYPTGTRTNRATAAGFWKATGRDKVIQSSGQRIGMRKTLVFYGGRAPHGQKSDWIMHEYRLDENTTAAHDNTYNASTIGGGDPGGAEDGWVVCRIFKKKNYPIKASPEHPLTASHTPPDGILDQILKYMGRSSATCKQEFESNGYEFPDPEVGFPHLPGLESPNADPPNTSELIGPSSDWAALDRLVASQLNGHSLIKDFEETDDFAFSFDQDDAGLHNGRPADPEISGSEADFWSFARSSSLSSSSDPLSHLSV